MSVDASCSLFSSSDLYLNFSPGYVLIIRQQANLRKGVRQRHLEDAFENQVRELDDHIDERVEEYEQET